jgi:hypothetical protein
LQCGVDPPHAVQLGPHFWSVLQATQLDPLQLVPELHAVQLEPQCASVLQATHVLFSQYLPELHMPLPVHSTHCPPLQTCPDWVQSVQAVPQCWLVPHAMHVPLWQ